MNRVDMQVLILAQHEYQRPAGLLDGQRNRLSGKTGKQSSHPGFDGFRGMRDFSMLALLGTRSLHRPDMLLVGPINGHKSAESGLIRGVGFYLIIHIASF